MTRVFFSFRSPFSWMALHVVRQRPEVWSDLELIPYWDPDARTQAALEKRGAEFHYVQMSKAKHLYILHDTRRQAARLGLKMAWPIDEDPWWEMPHLAWLAARRQGRQDDLYDALVEARWQRGENICDPDVLANAATSAGLDPAAMSAAPNDDDLREEGTSCLEQAYHDDIFGIPYFRIGRHRYWGLDRVNDFLAMWREKHGAGLPTPDRTDPRRDTQPDVTSHLLFTGPAYDTDTAGGCG